MNLFLSYLMAFFIAFLVPSPSAISEETVHESPGTGDATIYYYREETFAGPGDMSRYTPPTAGQERNQIAILMKENIDKLVYRVKELLGIYPPGLHFNIYLCRTSKELADLFREIGMKGETPVAFYSHRHRTIYLSDDQLNDSILAHEVTHAVINSYFEVPPPSQIQEILAHYVEKHLGDK